MKFISAMIVHIVATVAWCAFVFTSAEAHAAYAKRSRSIGTTSNLGAIQAHRDVNVPLPQDQDTIVGIGISGSDSHVWVWYADKTFSSGTSGDFEHYHPRHPFTLSEDKKAWDIIAMAVSGSDKVYAWYSDGTVSAGWVQFPES